MGLVRDFNEDHEGQRFKSVLLDMLSPRVWLRLHKWRKQRADRGWSDRDTWGAGDHIARMTAEMLQYLNDHSYCDWPEWFKLNVKEEGKGAYKDLQTVIDDINNYLEFSETTWGDDLTTKYINTLEQPYETEWYNEKGKKITQAEIKHRVNKWVKEENRLYKKATKAMGFFGRHFSGFWD